jgi:hypothetical protein
MKTPEEMAQEISGKCHTKAAVWFDHDECAALLTTWREECVENARPAAVVMAAKLLAENQLLEAERDRFRAELWEFTRRGALAASRSEPAMDVMDLALMAEAYLANRKWSPMDLAAELERWYASRAHAEALQPILSDYDGAREASELASKIFEGIALRIDHFFKASNIQGGVRCGDDLFSPMDKHELAKAIDQWARNHALHYLTWASRPGPAKDGGIMNSTDSSNLCCINTALNVHNRNHRFGPLEPQYWIDQNGPYCETCFQRIMDARAALAARPEPATDGEGK